MAAEGAEGIGQADDGQADDEGDAEGEEDRIVVSGHRLGFWAPGVSACSWCWGVAVSVVAVSGCAAGCRGECPGGGARPVAEDRPGLVKDVTRDRRGQAPRGRGGVTPRRARP